MNAEESLIKKALVNSEKAKVIPINRLQSVRYEIDRFKQNEELNGFQKWIVDSLYNFEVPDVGFTVKSIILIAVPHPFHASVELSSQGRKYNLLSLVMSDFAGTDRNIRAELSSTAYRIAEAGNIPLKRLAVQSGFAEYGRNNICYIDGMGSNFSFLAYYSDIPCDHKFWRDAAIASRCANCNLCLNNCPTGAIQPDRFLIDNERCLSYLNESGDPFPEWLPESVHHCIYDCLKCQAVCPMNKGHVKNVAGPVKFTETETSDLITGTPIGECSEEFQEKARYLGLHQWPDGISKNIKILMEYRDQDNVPGKF